jgi:hypothetical protein
MVGRSFGNPPKKLIRPLRAVICSASCWAAPEAAAVITTSAPRPSVSLRTSSTASVSDAQIAASGSTTAADMSNRDRFSSTRNTRLAPFARASRTCRQPIGPAPTTTTSSPGPTPASSCPFTTHANGSATDASAKLTPSGIRFSPSTARTALGTTRNSANPPS